MSSLPPHGAARPALRGRVELLGFLGAYLVYDLARWLTVGDADTAERHARAILDLERDLGVAVERSVQDGLDSGPIMWLLSNVYLAAQLVVLPGVLLWLYRRTPAIYARLRSTVIATWMLAIPVYALFPVAPPRLADVGLADSVGEQAGVALTGRSTMFFNPLAAVPSLHCGFAVAIGVAAAFACRGAAPRVIWLLWGPLVCLTVVATGNHHLFDIVAGLAAAAAGYLSGRALERLRIRDRTPRRPRIGTPRLSPRPA